MAAQVRARVVERVDLGLEVAGGAVEDRAGREDARRAEEAGARELGRGEDLAGVVRGIVDGRDAEGERGVAVPVLLRQDAVRAEGAVVVGVDEAGQDGLARDVVRLRPRGNRDRSPPADGLDAVALDEDDAVLDDLVAVHRHDAAAGEGDRARAGGMSTGSTKEMFSPCAARLGQLLGRARQKRERLLQVPLVELGPVGPVEPRRVAGEVQELARLLRDARHAERPCSSARCRRGGRSRRTA